MDRESLRRRRGTSGNHGCIHFLASLSRSLDAGSLAHVALLESQQRYLDRERQYHEVVGPGCDPAVLTAGRQCGDIRWGRLGRRRGRGGGRAKARRRQLEVEVVALEELRERLVTIFCVLVLAA